MNFRETNENQIEGADNWHEFIVSNGKGIVYIGDWRNKGLITI
jgi:hypothetical protein